MENSDPRVYFAAERTLLAWVRTGVALVGLGFIVARFGLLLQIIQPTHPSVSSTGVSALLGSVLVISGGVFTGLAALSFARFLRSLGSDEKPRSTFTALLALLLALMLSGVGLLLGVFLLLGRPP